MTAFSHTADAWVYTRPPAPAVDAVDVPADVAALRAAHGQRPRDGAPLALVNNVLVSFDPAVGVVTGAGVLYGHLAEPVDLTRVSAPTLLVRVLTRGHVDADELLTRFGFAVPVPAKRAATITYEM